MKLVVVGLGKVGLVLSVALASAGHRVVGVDVDAERVAEIRTRSVVTQEPGIESRLRALSADDLDATTDIGVVEEADAIFVIVPTPSAPGGGFALDYVLRAIDDMGPALGNSQRSPVVSLVSTVMPGSSESTIIPRLESAVGRRIGDRLGYGYNPAFIALGDVLKGFVQPDLVLIGEADEHSGDVLSRIHSTMVPVRTPVVRLTPVEAEITKLASNAHETMRVAFVNMLLAACERTPGSDVDAITEALTFRHGQRLFRGAVPYGGPCWPRDNHALSAYLHAVGAPSDLPEAVHRANNDHATFLLEVVRSEIPAGDQTVVVAGLAYKPGTDVLDESFGMWLLRHLADDPALAMRGWDPNAFMTAAAEAPADVVVSGDLEDCLPEATVLIVALPLPQLSQVDWSAARPDLVVIDPWRVLAPIPHVLRGRYRGIGNRSAPAGESGPSHGARGL